MGTLKYAGNGTSKAFLPDVKGMIVLNPGTTITVALAKTLAGWQAKINPATSAEVLKRKHRHRNSQPRILDSKRKQKTLSLSLPVTLS
jgi:microcystin-dependent protein